MDIRPLSTSYSVSPQIAPEDIPAIKAAGFTTIICNRPDAEIPAELQAEMIRLATEAAGLKFVFNPVTPGVLTMDLFAAQSAAMKENVGPVLAYCASGNRCSIVWAFLQAGTISVDEIIATTARAGYRHEGLRAQLAAFAAR